MLKTYQFKTYCKGDSHSSKTENIVLSRLDHDKTKVNALTPFRQRNGIQIHSSALSGTLNSTTPYHSNALGWLKM